MNFEELLESEIETLEEHDILSYDEAEEYLFSLKEEFDITDEDVDSILEALVKRVSSTGNVQKTRTRQQRSKRATRTTGMSRSQLKRRARKAAKTRSRTSQVGAKRKRKKAMKIRRRMGLS